VAYCRGEYCELSFEAVTLLRARGFKARRLEKGLPKWRAAGLPINKNSSIRKTECPVVAFRFTWRDVAIVGYAHHHGHVTCGSAPAVHCEGC